MANVPAVRRLQVFGSSLLLAILFTSLASAEINFNYPSDAEYGKSFDVSIELINFSSGSYDAKIDILNESGRIAQILNNGEWKSTYYYVIGAINTSVSNLSSFSMNITEKYNGAAIINITLRKSSTYKFGPYNLNVIYSVPQPQENTTNQTTQNNGTINNTTQNNETLNNQTQQSQQSQNQSSEQQTETKNGYNYSVIEYPSKLSESFIVKVKIENYENASSFEVWSYVYSSSVCYSIGGREYNNITSSVNKNEIKILELKNQVNISKLDENKSYKLKVDILREGLKTPREFTFDLSNVNLTLISPENNSSIITSENNPSTEGSNLEEDTTSTVQTDNKDEAKTGNRFSLESKTAKIRNWAIYIYGGLMTMLCGYLILKKE